jgi:hypothetical protein
MKDSIAIIICLTIVCFVLFTQTGFDLALNATSTALDAIFSATENFSH